jgi:hypothetical protein
MKRVVVMAVLLAAIGVNAQTPEPMRVGPKTTVTGYGNISMGAVWKRTMIAADTLANAGYKDTVYSAWYEVPAFHTLHFNAYINGRNAKAFIGYKDSAFTRDTVFVSVQSSTDASVPAVTTSLGTIEFKSADLDTQVAYKATAARDSTIGSYPYLRAMFVTQDSTTTARPSILGNTYARFLSLFLLSKQ